MKKMLKVKNLNVKIDNKKIIENLSFELKKGEVLTILGPNGAGKTVLLKTLLGIFPYQGQIIWEKGIKIGYVPQRLPFIKDTPMSVEEFFKLKETSSKEIKGILDSVGFKENPALFQKRGIGGLSSGQFQRILIAWSLVKNPDVLLFDEPTTGIDIGGEETVYTLLAELRAKKNLTILLITHDLSVVFKFSDFVICLNKCPICHGTPKEILTPKVLQKVYGQEIKFYEHYKH